MIEEEAQTRRSHPSVERPMAFHYDVPDVQEREAQDKLAEKNAEAP